MGVNINLTEQEIRDKFYPMVGKDIYLFEEDCIVQGSKFRLIEMDTTTLRLYSYTAVTIMDSVYHIHILRNFETVHDRRKRIIKDIL